MKTKLASVVISLSTIASTLMAQTPIIRAGSGNWGTEDRISVERLDLKRGEAIATKNTRLELNSDGMTSLYTKVQGGPDKLLWTQSISLFKKANI